MRHRAVGSTCLPVRADAFAPFCRRRGTTIGHRKRRVAWTSSPDRPRWANDPTTASSSSTVPTVPTPPARHAGKGGLATPATVPRHDLARRDGLLRSGAWCRPGPAGARCPPHPARKRRGRPHTMRGQQRTAGEDGGQPREPSQGLSDPRDSNGRRRRDRIATPEPPGSRAPGTPPWALAGCLAGTLPLTLLTGLSITVADADRAPPGGR